MPKKVVGQSKIYRNFRISIVELKEILNVEEGDRVYFVKDNGKIEIRKMKP